MLLPVGSCVKYPCAIAVPVTYTCDNVDELLLIEVEFKQGKRYVGADVVHQNDFVGGVFKLKYRFEDTSPDSIIWRVFALDRSRREFRMALR